jgi:hypothetical protein
MLVGQRILYNLINNIKTIIFFLIFAENNFYSKSTKKTKRTCWCREGGFVARAAAERLTAGCCC